MQNTRHVHPAVLRRMRNYATKQALEELGESRDPSDIDRIAKRHMLGYTELKRAITQNDWQEAKIQRKDS